jgi:hypothetical protein
VKIERYALRRRTIEEFAGQNGLTMEVRERGCQERPRARFYARFKDSEVSEGCALVSAFGNGESEAAAIEDYAERISGQLLVLSAGTPARRSIQVPILAGCRGSGPGVEQELVEEWP